MWNGALQEKFNFNLQGVVCYCWQDFVFWEEVWALGYNYMRFWDYFDIFLRHLAIHDLLVYTSLLLIIRLRFTCSERKIWQNIKNSQNIMTMIVATKQEVFFTKVAPVPRRIDIVLLDFSLLMLSSMFISFYTTIHFFQEKFIFSNAYVSVNTIFEWLHRFFSWERGHQETKCATGEVAHPKYEQIRKVGGCMMRLVCVFFHVFGSIFVL